MASNDKNFVVKNGITIGAGTGNSFVVQSTDGVIGQALVTDGSGVVTWQNVNFDYIEGDIDGGTY